ncbi:CapA family protein [Bradyrhizobium sediminis]|uniref:CapA family protein n=2 Tax=Bradyrhizobium sediminis TaxID=2840469 RepID=A0A975NSL1_9BRAD|nr:CapA family protein [Bradyrhizobium sediminis]
MSATAQSSTDSRPVRSVRLFLCGDVMTGRGIDQVLPHPCDPTLHEDYVASAKDYVGLAEHANGPIPRHAEPSYVWGAALDELSRMQPDARIINLETAITRSDDYVRKSINYRMSPENADCLSAAGIDCCVLANNHVLDWGPSGLLQTLAALEHLKIKAAGAGRNASEAAAPAALDLANKARVLVFSFGAVTSGIPRSWAATTDIPGVNLLTRLSEADALRAAEYIVSVKQPGDLAVVSLHWGSNWGYEIPEEQQRFARTLIDRANVSIIHGHSSHHAKAVEVYHKRLILYGCGDFLNDYEGIRGHEEFRSDLALMYFADIEPATGDLAALEIIPLQIRKFRLDRPSRQDIEWMQQTLQRECLRFKTGIVLDPGGRLVPSHPMSNRLAT